MWCLVCRNNSAFTAARQVSVMQRLTFYIIKQPYKQTVVKIKPIVWQMICQQCVHINNFSKKQLQMTEVALKWNTAASSGSREIDTSFMLRSNLWIHFLTAVWLRGSSAETYQLRRERAKCLHCQGNHDSAGHEGLRGDEAMIKTEQHWDKVSQCLGSQETRDWIVKIHNERTVGRINVHFFWPLMSWIYGKWVEMDFEEWCQDILQCLGREDVKGYRHKYLIDVSILGYFVGEWYKHVHLCVCVCVCMCVCLEALLMNWFVKLKKIYILIHQEPCHA